MAMSIWYKFFSVRSGRQLKELYVFSILFSIASALILIFEPVFFYQEGVALSRIALYYALHYSLYIVLLPLGGKFAGRYGLERSLSWSMPLFVVYFVTLAAIPFLPGLFWLTWVLLTLFKIFYWPAYHAEVCKYSDDENRGTELSWLFAFTQGVGVLGPVAGGLIAAYFGFSVLFVVAASLALLAAFPLLRTRERFRRQAYDYWSPWRVITARRYRGMVWTMLGWGENLIDMVFWPVFMFIILGGAAQLGLVASLNVVVMTLLGFLVGEISDRFSYRRVLRWHIPFMVLGYLWRPLAATSPRVFLTDTLSKAAFIGIRIPMWHRLYRQGRQAGALSYVVALEIVLSISKAITAWALVGVFAFTLPPTGFTVAWLIAAVLTTLYVFL